MTKLFLFFMQVTQGFDVFIANDGTIMTNVSCVLTCVVGSDSIGK